MRQIFIFLIMLQMSCKSIEVTKTFYNNGQIRSRTQLKDNELHGKQKLYYPNGKLQRECSYKNGLCSGKVYYYYLNGKLQERYNLDTNCFKNGIYKQYYDNGELAECGKYTPTWGYVVNSLDSATVLLYKSSKIAEVKTGKWKSFYRNGQIKSEENFANYYFIKLDTINDYSENSEFLINITVAETISFVKNGYSIYYDSTGTIVKREIWIDGIRR